MTFRTADADEIALMLDWAADEGWNPGLDDAAAFRAADPDGFFVAEVDGEPVAACATDTVASLLLRHVSPEDYRRSAVTGEARAPLCMMGVCFECLVEIDGQENQQGCLIRVRNGMRIRRQLGGRGRS